LNRQFNERYSGEDGPFLGPSDRQYSLRRHFRGGFVNDAVMGFLSVCYSEQLAGWNMNSAYKIEQSIFQNILAQNILSSLMMKTKKKKTKWITL
jgi:hypothetical protein